MMRNLLAIFHIAIIPIIIYWISRHSEGYIFAAIALLFLSIIISIAEWLYIKQKRDKESFLRPFSDKLLVLTVLLFLTITGSFAWTILSLFVLRDVVVGMIRFRAA